MAEKWHSGISMHKLPVGSGFVGLLFAAGSALIFVLGFPTLWYFVAFSAALGVGIAVLFRALNRPISEQGKPISILRTSENPATPLTAGRVKRQDPPRRRLVAWPISFPHSSGCELEFRQHRSSAKPNVSGSPFGGFPPPV